MLFGALFAVSYCVTYFTGAYLTQHHSANFSTMVGSVASPIQIVVLYSIPAINALGGGDPFTTVQMIYGVVSIVVIVPGMLIFHYFSVEKVEKEEMALRHEGKGDESLSEL